MTTFFYKDNKKITLTPQLRETISSDIVSLYKEYSKDLEVPIEETKAINEGLFPCSKEKSKIEKIPDLYEQYKTYRSALQRTGYSDYKAIVDVEGLDLKSNSLAATYKSSLIYDWYNINLMDTIDKLADDWTKKGEATAYLYWRKDVYQRTSKLDNIVINPETGEETIETITIKEDIPTFEAVDVKYLDSHRFVFDKSQLDNWDSCKKIYRSFMSVSEILANQSFDLTVEEKSDLRKLVKEHDVETPKGLDEVTQDQNLRVYGNTVEVLEFEGDYVIPGKTDILRRMEATVIAGRFLAKFQESDKPQSPFIWGCYMARPDTGRGQSPMQIPRILNSVENMCMDLMMTCWYNTANPVFLAPKGALSTVVDIRPGKPVEYDQIMMDNQRPTPIDFSAGLRGFDFTAFLKNKMENATGITQYMQGSQDGSVRTASEAAMINAGATMRMEREAFLFSHRVLYPLVRKYALYKKVFDTRDMEVRLDENDYRLVDEAVRSGNYRFIIGGAQSAVAREAETQKILSLFNLGAIQSLASIMNPVQAAELLKWVMNRLNLQGTDQVTAMLDSNQQLQQMARQMGITDENIPQFTNDVNQYINDNRAQIGRQYINQLMSLRNNMGG